MVQGHPALNLVLTTLVFILVAHEVNKITNELVPIIIKFIFPPGIANGFITADKAKSLDSKC